jgi:predicted nucleotidyltransferase
MAESPSDFTEILRVLSDHDVDFIVVGALSAVLQGAPIMTLDIDVVHERSRENVQRLLDALEELDAHYRGHGGRVLRPTADRLLGTGHQLLTTRAGPLDVLGAIEDELGYEDLLEDTLVFEIDGRDAQVLTMRRYLSLKEMSDRPKDRAVVPLLRATLEEADSEEE